MLQGWPSGGSMGQAGNAVAGGQDAAGFSAGASSQQGGYSMPQDGLGQAGGYPQQAAFAAFSPQQSGMPASQVTLHPLATTQCCHQHHMVH